MLEFHPQHGHMTEELLPRYRNIAYSMDFITQVGVFMV